MNILNILTYLRGIVGLQDAAIFIRDVCTKSGIPFGAVVIKSLRYDNGKLRVHLWNKMTQTDSHWDVVFQIHKAEN